MANQKWVEESDVVVVGYGGAGAATAIAAHDCGAKVLILEKHPCDTRQETTHTPSTRLSGGGWWCPNDAEKAQLYLKGLAKIAGETMDPEREEIIATFARALVENYDWVRKIGVVIQGPEDGDPSQGRIDVDGSLFVAEYPKLLGAECSRVFHPKATGKYYRGTALFKYLSDAIQSRGIPVMWETRGLHLIMERGKVRGVVALSRGKEVAIKARRAVVLTCGGFEFNQWMKENYLRVNPAYFYGNPGNTGDGINMALEIGAALWHMNNASWRAVMHFSDFPVAFGTNLHETGSIFVDKRGRRFANERWKMHSFGYELTNFDTQALCYPKVPFYWIFDEKRRVLAPVAANRGGAGNPPGGVGGPIFYVWSADNRKEIERGWITKANTIGELAKTIAADPDNGGLMDGSTLEATIRRYNENCHQGKDTDFGKPKEFLQPIEDPPYYVVKLWPGGPNTQGGPKRNKLGQVVRVDNSPVPRLYSAGELGSVFGMIYQGAGNLGEVFAFGRIAGTNAASERPW